MTSKENVLYIFVLFCLVPFILCMCILATDFLPVHAAESVSGMQIFESVHTEKGSWVQTETYSLNKSAQYNIFMFGDPDHTHMMYIAYVNPDDDLSIAYSSVIKYENPSLDDNVYNSNDSFSKITTLYTLSDGTKIYLGNIGGTDGQKFVYKGNYGLYETSSDMTKVDNLRQFLEHFYVIKDITPSKVWGDSEFDPHDDAYAFTGFSMSGRTATWTGTTERSYLLDMDVEEWVNYTYGFATSEDQEVSSFIDAEAHYKTSDKKLALPWDEMEANKKEGEFIRQVNIIPCYGTSGAGFYFGSPVCVYFDAKGNIEKVIHKSKPTDLNKGNMVYDSSIGYLQNVIYTEQKSHDGTGRQATFKWSTQKSLPSDAQVEIVAQNFYIEWFNKKTEENFIFKEYGEDCFYSAGSYSFNANTPVWTWLKEKEIDPFSIKTQSYGSTEYYLRIVIYDESDLLYHYGGWVKVDIKSKDTTNLPSTDVETGGFDDSSGLWNQDTTSSDSYHYSTDDDGKLTGNIDVNSWEDLNMNSFTWMYRNMQSMVSSLGEFPTMVNAVFGYLPVQLITAIGVLLVAIVLLRFLGR